MQFSIDRNSPVPAYYQIQLDLSDRIQRGEWNDRKQLPSESTLAEQYAVSRITLRQALAELEKDGIIKKSRGCGAKICEKPAPFVHKMDFYSIVSTHEGHDGKQVTSQVLNIRRFDTPTEDVIEHLQLEPGTPVVYIKRLFLFDDKPLAVGRSWLSLARFPGLDETGLGEKGLTATLRSRYNTIIRRFNDAIEAVRPAPDERNLLDVSYDCPLLMVRGLSFDQHNVPVEYSTTYWLGDKVRFTVSMNTQEVERGGGARGSASGLRKGLCPLTPAGRCPAPAKGLRPSRHPFRD